MVDEPILMGSVLVSPLRAPLRELAYRVEEQQVSLPWRARMVGGGKSFLTYPEEDCSGDSHRAYGGVPFFPLPYSV